MTKDENSSGTGAGNHLAGEKSPYLRQHATNPVDWYPWGDEAFDRARELNRPVFLSIGYATCHWCHVMARESFEDEEIAGILNSRFVPVKVDREERPDIDSVYMAACQAMTGQGGWPLTILMTPDKRPFFAGTYLPPRSRAGMVGLDHLLIRAAGLWNADPATLEHAAEELVTMLAGAQPASGESCVNSSLLDAGYRTLAQNFDRTHGGFGRAPKFPSPTTLLFLLRYWKRTGSGDALAMVERTLDALRCGGIHDHLGGGFHRYATDRQWMVPHFEKMLYDQALLLMAFTEAWQVSRRPEYRTTAQSIVSYVTRDLFSSEGAFFSAEDADSPGGEGAFYVWTYQEFIDTLGQGDGEVAAGWFGVTRAGNFGHSGEGEGRSILSLCHQPPAVRDDGVQTEHARAILLSARNRRPRPQRDTKILADWNCMMIAALAQASRALGEPSWYTLATRAMSFILTRLRLPDGGLAHRYCDGEAAVPAFADDYAWAIRALTELYCTGQDPGMLEQAIAFCTHADAHFSSPGGEYFTVADTAEALILRRIEIHDGATPSSNAVMLQNLCMLSGLTGDPAYETRAVHLAGAVCGPVQQYPSASCALLSGFNTLLDPGPGIVLAGQEGDPLLSTMRREVWNHYLPDTAVHVKDNSRKAAALDRLAPFTSAMTARDGSAAAYVCKRRTCHPPVHSVRELAELLKMGEKGSEVL